MMAWCYAESGAECSCGDGVVNGVASETTGVYYECYDGLGHLVGRLGPGTLSTVCTSGSADSHDVTRMICLPCVVSL